MPDNYCVECKKEFRSQSGLNGHNQWKHNKLTENPLAYTVTGRAVEMFERVGKQLDAIRDEQENLKDMIQSLQRNGIPPGQGNDQGLQDRLNNLVNGPNATTPAPAPAPAPVPRKPQSEDGGFKCGHCEAELPGEVAYCSECGSDLTWPKRR